MANWMRAAVVGMLGLLTIAAGEAPDGGLGAMAPAMLTPAVSTDVAVGPMDALAHDDVTDEMDAAPARPASLERLVADVRAEGPVQLTAEAKCLATAVYFESKGEPLAGQLAVAQVVLNRVSSGRWADGACAVIAQPRQFSFMRGGRAPDPRERDAWEVAKAVALIALSDSWRDVAGRATHFHATRVSPGWSKTRVATIGNHVFYR